MENFKKELLETLEKQKALLETMLNEQERYCFALEEEIKKVEQKISSLNDNVVLLKDSTKGSFW